jgi:biopolymer transport protein TolR
MKRGLLPRTRFGKLGPPRLRPPPPRRTPGAVQADINVTPLVDVVLVLLIIFMVVGPALAQSLQVQLPRTEHHQNKADERQDVIVAVTRAGEIHLRDRPVTLSDLTARLRDQRERAPSTRVYLEGDDMVDYSKVREVMEAARGAGIEEVLLVTRAQTQPE